LQEFSITIQAGRKIKSNFVMDINGKVFPISFFGDDFKFYDQHNKRMENSK